jgi:hypothetical protein
MAELMAMARQQSGQTNPSSGQNQTTQPTMQAPSAAAPAEKVKIGVADFNNKTKAQIPTDSLRDQLITVLNGNGIDAVPLNSSSASEAAIEAKAKGCSYILFTDVSSYKSPSTGKKIGGLLGRATGTPSGDSGKAEAKLDFRLLAADGATAKLQSSASGKEDTADASVNAALQEEARAVAGAVGRN